MHCPRCGQQQLSEDVKYCSRCGFSLEIVTALIAGGGFLPELPTRQKRGFVPWRKTGMKIGLSWFLFFTVLLTPLFGIAIDDELAGLTAVLGTLGGLLIVIFSWMFLPKQPMATLLPMRGTTAYQETPYFNGNVSPGALPPLHSRPADSYIPPPETWRAPNTGELTKPGSVTEGTTKLLHKDEQHS